MRTLLRLLDQRRGERFVDRETELAAFLEMLEESDCPYRILAFDGVAGVGKSFLLGCFVGICRRREIPHVLVDCSTATSGFDFISAFRDQLRSQGISSTALRKLGKTADRLNKILGRLYSFQKAQDGRGGFLIRSALSAVKTFLPIAAPVLDGLSAEERLQEIVDSQLSKALSSSDRYLVGNAESILTSQLIEAINDANSRYGHCVNMFDTYEQVGELDHWIREKLLPELSDATAVVVAGREPLGRDWAPIRLLVREITLVNFSSQTTQEYLCRRGITQEEFAQEIFQFTRGHPLSIAISADIKEKQHETPSLELQPAERFLVVKTLLDRILARISDTNMCQLLEACAVVRRFDEDVLLALEPQLDIKHLLNDLRDFSFVGLQDNSFVLHDLVRDYLLDELKMRSPERYRRLNSLALEHYRQQSTKFHGQEHKKVMLELLYHQLILDEGEGINIFRILFEGASRSFDISFCETLISQMQSSTLDDRKSRDWVKYYQSALAFRRGKWNDQEQISLSLLRDPGVTADVVARAAMDLGNAYMRHGKMNMAESTLQRSLKAAEELGDGGLEADVLLELGKVCRWQNEWAEALEHFSKAEALFRSSQRTSRTAEALMHIGAVNQLRGHFDEGLPYLERSMQLFTETGNRYGLSRALINTAWILVQKGNWKTAKEYCQRSYGIAEELGLQHSLGSILIVLGDLARLESKLDDSYEYLQRSREILEKLTYDVYLGMLHRSWALLLYDRGQRKEAIESLRLSKDSLQAIGAFAELSLTLAYQGVMQAQLGDNSAAKETLNEALNLLDNYEQPYARAKALIGLCHVAVVEAAVDPADILREAEQICEEFAYHDLLVETNWVKLSRTIDMGNWPEAASLCADAMIEAILYNHHLLQLTAQEIALCCQRIMFDQQGDQERQFIQRIHSAVMNSDHIDLTAKQTIIHVLDSSLRTVMSEG